MSYRSMGSSHSLRLVIIAPDLAESMQKVMPETRWSLC